MDVFPSDVFLFAILISMIEFDAKVYGTETTAKAVEKYRPDIEGKMKNGGFRTCYVVQIVFFSNFIPISGKLVQSISFDINIRKVSFSQSVFISISGKLVLVNQF